MESDWDKIMEAAKGKLEKSTETPSALNKFAPASRLSRSRARRVTGANDSQVMSRNGVNGDIFSVSDFRYSEIAPTARQNTVNLPTGQ